MENYCYTELYKSLKCWCISLMISKKSYLLMSSLISSEKLFKYQEAVNLTVVDIPFPKFKFLLESEFHYWHQVSSMVFFFNHMFIFFYKFIWLVNHNLCVSNCCKKKWFFVIHVASSAHQYKNCIMALHSGNKCALEHRKDIGLCHTSLHNVF